MKKLTLSVQDRIYIQLLIPSIGGRIKMLLATKLFEAIQFTLDEITQYGIRDLSDGSTIWDRSEDIAISLSVEQVDLLKEGVDKADKENRIYREMIPLVLKIDDLK
ncbi:hypothetical protein [Dyadobacter sp. 3J3]|uniref:hypothetical protein n=1 Tax=Dyadobacter sp. 3J3 TaxID=2606600 RepID=UPI00135CD8F4|nr:hypothetical protein [Dyadobacter sp. 3J3]